MNQVGRQQNQLEEGNIGGPALRRNLTQRIVIEELSVAFLDIRSSVIEQIGTPGIQLEVRHKDVITIFAILEERQLLGFLRVFGNRSPHHDKTMSRLPM